MTGVSMMFMHAATVEPYLGSSPSGPRYGPAVTLAGLLDDGLMQTPEAGGSQLVSKTTFYTDLGNDASFPVGSRLTCNGRSMIVTEVRRRDGGSLLSAASHLEVDCT